MISLIRNRFARLTPAQILVLYYAVIILFGAALLATPFAAVGDPLPFLDALFTATSAQCVTGLIVVDTGTRLSFFGQFVVLALIQIGGIGIMTFSVYLFIYLRLGVGFRGRWLVQETLLHTPVSSWSELIRGVVILTLAMETVGALLLSLVFIPQMGWAEGAWCALFHSVSAFCNAGFSLFSNSLVDYQNNALLNLTVMGLIIVGGIGFLVVRELLEFCQGRRKKRSRLSLHSRLVLITTGFLIAYGALMIGWLESDGALASKSIMERSWIALFQSVTARTAGFNTIDLGAFADPTLFLIIFLMFVGASPGSAGGGIKTTSLAIFFCILYNRLRGSRHASAFRRTIPDETVTKTLALTVLAVVVVCVALFMLLLVQQPLWHSSGTGAFLAHAFEAVSALATVGLSLGVTQTLTEEGKVIVIMLMFVGRVGLLMMAFAIAGRTKRYAPRYAEENIMIG